MEQTYVFKGKEVFLTGRKAIREGKRRNTVIFEVKPVRFKEAEGEWVEMRELFEIVESQDE